MMVPFKGARDLTCCAGETGISELNEDLLEGDKHYEEHIQGDMTGGGGDFRLNDQKRPF